MTIQMEDRSGAIRDPEDFAEARKVVIARMIKAGGVPQHDIELFMQYTTIIQALEIAEAISRAQKAKNKP